MLKNLINTSKISLLVGLCTLPTISYAAMPNSVGEQFGIVAPQIAAKTYFLMDYQSGAILAEKNAEERLAPASLTKMMTSYVIGDAIKKGQIHSDDIVTISKNAWGHNFPGSSQMFLNINQKVPVSDLNRGIIVHSGNDACVAMAEYLSGSQDTFVQKMNSYAKKFGLKNTHFMTVHGLDKEGQYSSAKDMGIIAWHIIHDLPNEYKIYSEKEFTFNKIRQSNRNRLLWDSSLHVDGLKTGHTDEAGYNLVTSATDNNNSMRLISVVMGTTSSKAREVESKKLLRWGFANFETVQAVTAGKVIVEEPLYYGQNDVVKLGGLKDIFITLPKGRKQDVKSRYELKTAYLEAPLKRGQVVGKIIYQLDGKDIAAINLQVLENTQEGSIFSRLWDWAVLTIKSLI